MQFITFEGGEGSGKTTIISLIKERLEREGKSVIMTREPGGVELAEKIRSLLVSGTEDMDVRTEVLLFAAARREHWVKKVKPALKNNVIVLCDRFIDSSIVYQGYARNERVEPIKQINEYATDGVQPTQTFYFDVDVSRALSRIVENNRETNRFDEKDLEFHHKVRHAYQTIAITQSDRIEWINANQSIEEVEQEVWNKIK